MSFYRSQNVLCRSKFFVSDQKFIYILCQSQTFCARQKDDLHSVKLVFVPAQKFLKRHYMQSNFGAGSKKFGPAQNICNALGPKMFCAGPIFLIQPKNLTAFSASSKPFVPAQRPILLNANYLFVWHKMFMTVTICK